MNKISQVWCHIQSTLFPFLEEELDPLTEKRKKLISILEMVRIEDFVPVRWWRLGCPPEDRVALAKAFVSKMVYNYSTTRELMDRLETTPNPRRICGWERVRSIPSESTFSRSFAELSSRRVTSLYDLMDSAYDADRIKAHSRSLGHVPIIDHNPRGGDKVDMAPATKRRYDERSTAERGFSMLKESFGGRNARVRGHE